MLPLGGLLLLPALLDPGAVSSFMGSPDEGPPCRGDSLIPIRTAPPVALPRGWSVCANAWKLGANAANATYAWVVCPDRRTAGDTCILQLEFWPLQIVHDNGRRLHNTGLVEEPRDIPASFPGLLIATESVDQYAVRSVMNNSDGTRTVGYPPYLIYRVYHEGSTFHRQLLEERAAAATWRPPPQPAPSEPPSLSATEQEGLATTALATLGVAAAVAVVAGGVWLFLVPSQEVRVDVTLPEPR